MVYIKFFINRIKKNINSEVGFLPDIIFNEMKAACYKNIRLVITDYHRVIRVGISTGSKSGVCADNDNFFELIFLSSLYLNRI